MAPVTTEIAGTSPQARARRHWWRLLLLLVALLFPLVVRSYYLSLGIEVLIFAIFALSLDLLLGYTGLASFGHAAFYGLGSYIVAFAALNLTENLLVTMPLVIVGTALAALLIGLFALRTSGIYFLMITLAAAQMLFSIAIRWSSVTGGSDGLPGIPLPSVGIGPLHYTFASRPSYYYLVLSLFLLSWWLMRRLVESPFGWTLRGIRENEQRMRALGYNTFHYKLAVFTISGAFAGIAGALLSHFFWHAAPETLYWTVSGEVLIMLIVGGAGTLTGPILGAALIRLLPNFASSYTDRWQSILGLVLILFVLFAPKGIIGLIRQLRNGTVMSQLQTEALSRNFGGLRAVNNVSFAVAPGERLALIGPNGAGKTTLFNLLSGELAPSEGRILMGGEEITRLSTAQRAQRGMGRTFQRNNLFPGLSVYENVQLAVQQRLGMAGHFRRPARHYEALRQETMNVLAMLDLAGRAQEGASTLSYGEQRQLEVALALAIRPDILLLDEPTAGMSPAETSTMSRMIAGLPREITVLVIEHDMDVVFNLADRIIVLHHGELIADGAPDQVRADSRVREVYLGLDDELDL